MRGILAILIAVATFVACLYIALWWGIVEPIMHIANAIDTDNISATLIGWEIIKFFVRGILAGIVGAIGFGSVKALLS